MKIPLPERLLWHPETLFATTRAVLLSYFLWSLFYLQFLTKILTGFPYLGLSQGGWALGPYLKVEGYPFTMVELFLGISITAGVVSIATVMMITVGSRSKWRLRSMVALFSVFPIGMALLQFQMKNLHLDDAERRLEYLQFLKNNQPEDDEFFDKEIGQVREMMELVKD